MRASSRLIGNLSLAFVALCQRGQFLLGVSDAFAVGIAGAAVEMIAGVECGVELMGVNA